MTRFLTTTALTLGAMIGATPALAADCASLTGMELESGTVTSAEIVQAGAFTQPAPPPGSMMPAPPPSAYADMPGFCRVRMTLTPSDDSDIKSEVWLPLDGWNGRYVGIGNGIWAGTISYSELGSALRRGYVAASTDTGHVGNGLDAEWAIGHPEKLVDFGYRAVHVTTVAAKQAIRAFYGQGPEISLWNSCSTGGRQGLMAARRYPGDFDAISAMAPANPMTDLMTQTMWAGWQVQRFAGGRLGPAELGMVHAAAIAQCDAEDGLEDGLISRPESCGFDPGTLQCEAGQAGGCLNPGQVAALRNLYGGVRAADGTQLLPGWPRGSEMQMMVLLMGQEPFPVATSYFRDLVFAGEPEWDWQALDYRLDLAAARTYGADMLNTMPADLEPFFARGGKLLLSHGWADGLIPASNTMAFYRALYPQVSQEVAHNQLRLFMVPGMDHCAGGEGPSEFDTLGTIDAWASGGPAPNTIMATRPTQAIGMPGAPPMPPREPMTRPLCAYPLEARYDGAGDPNDAASFTCAVPE